MGTKKIRIFIVDDHEIVIDGLHQLLSKVPDFEVVGQACNGQDFLEKFSQTPADVVLMDIRMPELNGMDTVEKAKAQYPQTKFLMLTMHTTREYIQEATQKGADGYISKTKGQKEFIEGIRRVLNDEFVVIVDLDQDTFDDLKPVEPKPYNLEELSDRERMVLCMIVQEYTTAEIAKKLYRSAHTIERHRKNIMNKLQVKNVAGMVRIALEYNLCSEVQLPSE